MPILNELEYYNLNMTSKLSIYLLTKWALSQARYGGHYHLHGKSRNSCWKNKWFMPFQFGRFRKHGLRFGGCNFFHSLYSVQLIWIILCSSLFSHHLKFFRVVCVNGKHPGSRTFFMGGGGTYHLAWLHFFGF